ncbi:MAG: hypothetical protein GX051_03155 [Clostridiales bacterium]|nr:hypothetical protein [Clostridiales bacterium]
MKTLNKTINSPKSNGVLCHDELALINMYSKKALCADEVYTFSVVLCDNEIDRDGERFSTQALKTLAELFKGKTGISDHSMKASDQVARIYDTEVETFPDMKTRAGEVYSRLKAKAYTPRNEGNASFIADIEAGIKKEVSVGCAAGRKICSVCGADVHLTGCAHKNGRTYSGKLCHTILCDPTDAYEWSFVAVPAQPAAGVIKSFTKKENRGENSMQEILKRFEGATDEGVLLSKAEAARLLAHLDSLGALADDGIEYRNELVKNALCLCATALPSLSRESADEICKKLRVGELREFTAALEKEASRTLPCSAQLALPGSAAKTISNTEFKI